MDKYNNITEAEVEQVDLIELLLDRQAELNTLLEITQAINRHVSSLVLIDMLELILKNSLCIQNFLLIIKDDDGNYKLISSFGGEYLVDNYTPFVLDFANDKKIVDLKGHIHPLLKDFRYFIKIFHKESALAYVFVGDLMAKDRILVKNRINYIRTLINVVIVALENKKLFKERIQKERLQKELELAGKVQNMFIPKELPVNSIFDFHAVYLPHQSIGGDFYDLIKLNEDEFLWCIADVSGKGISAALLMSNFQASLRALAGTGMSLEELVIKLNTLVCKNTKGEKFITVFLGKFNNKTCKIEYINSGHAAPILIQNNEATLLRSGSVMIGVFEELPFVNVGNINVTPGAMVFNYTDGLVEFDGEEENVIEEEVLTSLILKNKELDLAIIHNELLSHVKKSHRSEEAMDDITMLSLRFR
ncbi:protein serine/threonine phosphatase [Pseudopedobacter saltans DSM 12145]|uniref:Protein serine/threonine phosphatase n=1 Tax=Pseudopedobacter saltans (strain ATCC 51119 / DSM 12145 / JCM 21818 / CCUG 39354 / LMG 10337 / NBRC 100064 / NCIMB 13643) TaxID=762903 RepID=F0S703_PSESL|nr:PP2C family protein-serine/threonine phosphatase [Pseudopedobacter saltans]ADY53266.1 protein serine/threonine phosphatase [Pseudopedobacter saltans DSM 12145]